MYDGIYAVFSFKIDGMNAAVLVVLIYLPYFLKTGSTEIYFRRPRKVAEINFRATG